MRVRMLLIVSSTAAIPQMRAGGIVVHFPRAGW